MQNSKLLSFLNQFTKEEMKGLRRFVNSPIHNTDKAIVCLFENIYKYQDNLQSTMLGSRKVYKKIFPDKEFNSNRLSVLQSGLLTLSKEYLALMEYKNEKTLQEKMLIQALGKLNNYDEFKKQANKSINVLEIEEVKDSISYRYLFEFYNAYYNHPENLRIDTKNQSDKLAIKNLDLNYIITRIRYVCGQYYNKDKGISFDEEKALVIIQLAKLLQKENIAIEIYLDLITLCRNDYKQKLYFKTREKLFNHYKKLETIDRRTILTSLVNQLNRVMYKKAKGNQSIQFFTYKFELYKFGLEKKILIINNQMTSITFKNIAVIGSYCKAFVWVEKFIEEYQKYLPEKERKSIVGLSLAMLYFHSQKYDKAYDILLEVDSWNEKYYLAGRSLNLRCHYEKFCLEKLEADFVMYKVNAFQLFLKRNKNLASDNKNSYLGFCKKLLKLIRLKEKINKEYGFKLDKKERDKIYHEVSEENPLILKKWLLEKIKDL